MRMVTILPGATVNLTLSRTEFCNLSDIPLSATANPAGGTFNWDLGDSTTATGPTLTHTYAAFGSYNPVVTYTRDNGCASKATRTINIRQPQLSGSSTLRQGCIPATNRFQSSIQLPAGSRVSSYQWNFGDGQTQTTTSSGVSHAYTREGEYGPKLTITTQEGCTATFSFDSVRYGVPLPLQFSRVNQTEFCASEPAVFQAYASRTNGYEWDFGNGQYSFFPDTTVQHRYTSVGVKAVRVRSLFNGCPGPAAPLSVTVTGAIARFQFENSCTERRQFQFTNNSSGSGALQYQWQLGHLNTTSTQTHISYTYPARSQFRVKLIAYEPISGCIDSLSKTVYTPVPNLINADNSLCINKSTQFRITNNPMNGTSLYTFTVLGQSIGPITDSAISVTARELGLYNSSVIIQHGPSYCPDTLRMNQSLLVKGPDIRFTSDSLLCQNIPLQLTNLSRPYLSTDPIARYEWDMGDNRSLLTDVNPAPYRYELDGTYSVKLSGTDINGCRDSLVRTLTIHPVPFVWIIPKNQTLCQGGRDSMIAYTSDRITWTASGPNIQPFCLSCDSVQISPLRTSTYFATATNAFQCVSKDSSQFRVFEPFQARPLFPDTSICSGETLTLGATPANKKIVWSPATSLTQPTGYTPSLTARSSETYRAELSDSAGCFKSTTEIRVVHKSLPSVELGNNRMLSYGTTFTLTPVYSSNVRSFLWSPSDPLSCDHCAQPTLTVDSSVVFHLRVTSDSGCSRTDQVLIGVDCQNAYLRIPGAFTPNRDGLNERFYPQAKGIKYIKRFTIFNRNSQVVFEQRDFYPNQEVRGWNGQFRNTDAPPGAYVYYIEAVCDLGQTTSQKGSFLLIR